MDETLSKLIYHEQISAILFFIAMLATSGIAYLKGFYRLEKSKIINVRIVDVITAFLLYLFVSLVIGSLCVSLFKKHLTSGNIAAFTIYLSFALSIFTIVLFGIYFYFIKDTILKPIFKIKSKTSESIFYDGIIGILSWLIVFPMISFISSLLQLFIYKVFKVFELPNQVAIDLMKLSLTHPIYFIMGFFQIVIFAPVLEEFLFRGVLHNFIKKYLGRVCAIVLTSLAFAFFHYVHTQKLSNITIIGSIFVLGCFLSFLYERQKSLYAPIFLHMTFNFITVLNLIFIKGT
ncbi:MAG: CPBP family intramembrane metalloprotease [Parachlamydiales bacterium]|nr:CPBP family intramembrane metalloprotease [Parachlamydiales bacterium]